MACGWSHFTLLKINKLEFFNKVELLVAFSRLEKVCQISYIRLVRSPQARG